jgi:hypothetical protein
MVGSIDIESNSVRTTIKSPLFWAASVGLIVVSYLSLFESVRLSTSIGGPGYSNTYFQLCIGLQPTALLAAILLSKRERALASGLMVGLLITDIVIPILLIIYSIYICSTGPCPLGLAG